MKKPATNDFDDIDSRILRILADDPRAPYSHIAEELQNEGFQMSSEGIRYRVSNLMEATTAFFLLSPEELNWEIVRIAVTAASSSGAKQEAFEKISEMRFWHVTRGLGTFDVFAVGMAPTLHDIDELVTEVRSLDCVDQVGYTVVTERYSNLGDYYITGDQPDDGESEN